MNDSPFLPYPPYPHIPPRYCSSINIDISKDDVGDVQAPDEDFSDRKTLAQT
jgi:hypothetical protein